MDLHPVVDFAGGLLASGVAGSDFVPGRLVVDAAVETRRNHRRRGVQFPSRNIDASREGASRSGARLNEQGKE